MERADPRTSPLARRYPELRLERTILGDWPTPIEPLPSFSGGGVRLWCKREDLSGGLYGGNKVRKLERLLPEAVRRGGGLVTIGAAGSNHMVATCLYARALGVPVDLLVIPQPATPHVVKNARISAALARRVWTASGEATLPAVGLRAALSIRSSQGAWAYPVWVGGSNPRGVAGWVEGGLEIAAQVAAGQIPEPSDVFVAAGSGGTVAGLALGLQIAGLETRVRAVRVVDRIFGSRAMAVGLARSAARFLRARGADVPDLDPDRITVRHDAFGGGYGVPSAAGEAARRRAVDEAGLYMEPTYTAKALASCLAAIDAGETGPEVLYIHTISSRPLGDVLAQIPEALPPEMAAMVQESAGG